MSKQNRESGKKRLSVEAILREIIETRMPTAISVWAYAGMAVWMCSCIVIPAFRRMVVLKYRNKHTMRQIRKKSNLQ
jgi:membrane protein CcdC involved in cytochrome C biogenesis